jgi:antitoxin Phd
MSEPMPKPSWQLQEAKAHLSEVVKRAGREGPQEITVHGTPAAVVLSARDYAKLAKPRPSLVEFIARSPLKGVELDLTRDRRVPRDVEL